ncbi:TraR/DksA C4-type zinc finger protein [Pasteurella multocida]|uniref:TraR/DksA C4-type zinc finger protein n=1 Tax=Pasteurella multocida TaxID=747 RepID=UPI000E82DEAF|nr:TraR/DksA C4-type zinc finger protein [Pasteurella multocida]QDA13542.1 TraR/DksA family transcriptional regulator [Pasteurella multocida subsp. multocida]MDY0489263.1 TraR/DksA C4-type zinc finger protein [Pasteurella multocida]MDY0595825.1 TraR/DksA C4-type zinc finger protein [Pasteurella multocida]MDY0665214.1 TraR/DksA C4-type zinc finger protein [Pasteurella multocida]MDY0667323.1 TraR/DksA C4-type zinc finger protein [Pasteurella multocida]
MSDELDQTQAREEAFWQQRLAPRLDSQLSDDEIKLIILTERDCAECGLPIPPARLQANPYAYRCIQCQQEKEQSK